MLTLVEIIDSCNGELLDFNNSSQYLKKTIISNVSIDSRSTNPNSLFIAIKGDKNDGHNYLNTCDFAVALIDNKAKVSNVDTSKILVLVENTKQALLKLAAFYRCKLTNTKFLAITGSCGKTTIKNILFMILSKFANTCATEGNLNNDLGTPLTIFKIKPDDKYAIIEIGANHIGEVAQLTELVRPDIVLISNIGDAHIGEFGSKQKIAEAKAEIIENSSGAVIINGDDEFFGFLKNKAKNRKVISFGFGKTNDFQIISYKVNLTSSIFKIRVFDKINYLAETKLLGKHNIANINAALAATFGIDNKVDMCIATAIIKDLEPDRGRLERIYYHNHLIINDSYNASPLAMKMAIEFANQNLNNPILVLADMLELGDYSEELHKNTINGIEVNNIQIVFSLGKYAHLINDSICLKNINCQSFKCIDKDSLLNQLLKVLRKNKSFSVLIKGSNATKINEVANYFV